MALAQALLPSGMNEVQISLFKAFLMRFLSGFRTLDDIRQAGAVRTLKITREMRIGLQYYDEFMQRIPRDEVELIAEKVISTLLHFFLINLSF